MTGSALKLVNTTTEGSFGVTLFDRPFDASAYPVVEFNYRIGPGVKTDFYAKVGPRWSNIGFTDDPNDFRHRRVNTALSCQETPRDAWKLLHVPRCP